MNEPMNPQRADGQEETRMSKWISVDERLPEEGTDVLGYYPDGCCEVVMYNASLKEFKRLEGEWPGCDPTHWMELPEPPE